MSAASKPVNRDGIAATHELIRSHIRHTPLVAIDSADFGLPTFPLRLKLELHAAWRLVQGPRRLRQSADPQGAEAGVVAASGGNHGVAVAFAANRLATKAAIFVPTISSPAKIERSATMAPTPCRRRALCRCAGRQRELGRQAGAMPIHAFDQAETMLGQGTVGLEIERDAARSTRCWSPSAAAG